MIKSELPGIGERIKTTDSIYVKGVVDPEIINQALREFTFAPHPAILDFDIDLNTNPQSLLTFTSNLYGQFNSAEINVIPFDTDPKAITNLDITLFNQLTRGVYPERIRYKIPRLTLNQQKMFGGEYSRFLAFEHIQEQLDALNSLGYKPSQGSLIIPGPASRFRQKIQMARVDFDLRNENRLQLTIDKNANAVSIRGEQLVHWYNKIK